MGERTGPITGSPSTLASGVASQRKQYYEAANVWDYQHDFQGVSSQSSTNTCDHITTKFTRLAEP